MTHQYEVTAYLRVFLLHLGPDFFGRCRHARLLRCFSLLSAFKRPFKSITGETDTTDKMNSLTFDDPSLDTLDPTLSLNDPSDIDTALLSDIDGKKSFSSNTG